MLPSATSRCTGTVLRVVRQRRIFRRGLNSYRSFASAVEERDPKPFPLSERRESAPSSSPIQRIIETNDLEQRQASEGSDNLDDNLESRDTNLYDEGELESAYDHLARGSILTNVQRCRKELNKLIQRYRPGKKNKYGTIVTFRSELAGICKAAKPANRFLERVVEYILDRKLHEEPKAFKRVEKMVHSFVLARKKSFEIRLDSEEATRILASQDVEQVNENAAKLTKHLYDNVPVYALNKVLTFLQEFVSDDTWIPKKLKFDKVIGVHYWLVAAHLGEFFRVPRHPEVTIVKGDKTEKQKEEWQRNRAETIEIMVKVLTILEEDNKLFPIEAEPENEDVVDQIVRDRTTDEEAFVSDDDDEKNNIDLPVLNAEEIVSDNSTDEKQLLSDSDDLVKSLPQIEHISSPAPPISRQRRRSRIKAHAKFEAIPTLDGSNPQCDVDPYQVFVDNLPVDITEQKLYEWYERCGPIKSIEIFNLRPELDPGPLPRRGQLERRKSQLRALAKASAKTWQRPCTPVYALLNFKNEKGYNMALDPSLKLFGMILERHQVRSISAQDSSSLYIENLPEYTRCSHIQSQLQMVVRDGMSIVQSGKEGNRLIKSCEIKFDTFEDAFIARAELMKLDLRDTTVNWFRTRDDAELWWKRELGFE